MSVVDPHPEGLHFAASIAHSLLPNLDEYTHHSLMEEILKVIVRTPKGNEGAFIALAQRASAVGRRDHFADKFAELLLTGPYGAFACADMPDVVIALAQAHFREPKKRRSQFHDFDPLDTGPVFGLNEHLDFEFSEASALRGPFLPLLHHHPAKGVRFILDALNGACECFAQRHGIVQYVDGPWQVALSFADRTVRTQWCEGALWGLYRGTSVGPLVLQCALMALENWLLAIGQHAPEHLERWLVHLLRESNNVAISAVVASVSAAFPQAAGQAALALLSCRDLILLDRQRMGQDQMLPSSWFPDLPPRTAESQLYANERGQSDRREHRKRDLEYVAVALSTGPLRSQVYAILDAHRSALPPENHQSDDDKVWRLALHRMDSRRYEVVEDDDAERVADTSPARDTGSGSEETTRRVLMMPRGLEPDLEAFRQEDAPRLQRYSEQMSLHMWGMSCFQGETEAGCDPTDWRGRLGEAIGVSRDDRTAPDDNPFARNAAAFVAAVCVRDYWGEMEQEERGWCLDELIASVRRDAQRDDMLHRVSKNSLEASRPCAFVLPLVLTYALSEEVREEVRQAVAVALTHVCDEVVTYAVEGIAAHLTGKDPVFLLSCVRAVAYRAAWLLEAWNAQRELDVGKRLPTEQLWPQVRPRVLEAILSNSPCTVDDIRAVNLEDPWGRDAMVRILAMLGHSRDSQISREAFAFVASAIARWWDADRERRLAHRHRDFRSEHQYLRRLAGFCLRLPVPDAVAVCAPLLAGVQAHRKEAEPFITDLTIAVDQGGNVEVFWALWQEFAKRAREAPWLDELDRRYAGEDAFLSALFLGGPWKEGVRHWRCLEGFSQALDELFGALPPKPTVFRCYARYLNAIGERSLPNAFVLLSRRLRAGRALQILSDQSVAFNMEVLLRRYVYGRPAELKSRPELCEAVLHLLDELVEAGSSAAYRMRDDFVTPGLGCHGAG